ncbi:MAG TPA: hypothetical protein VN722_08320 [Hanamia sp.]|nr:hypothetical protein [Hanamia sp.]
MNAPNKILIPSDSNEMELIQIIKTKKELSYEYTYTKSATKSGKITFPEEWLKSI